MNLLHMDFVHASESSAWKQCVKHKEMRKWEGIWIKVKLNILFYNLKGMGYPKLIAIVNQLLLKAWFTLIINTNMYWGSYFCWILFKASQWFSGSWWASNTWHHLVQSKFSVQKKICIQWLKFNWADSKKMREIRNGK